MKSLFAPPPSKAQAVPAVVARAAVAEPAAVVAANDNEGVANLRRGLRAAVRRALRPPPKLTLSEWADKFAYLSPENSAEPGKWTSMGYQRGIMDAITDPKVEEVSVMKSARVGYTKIIDHAIGYYAHQDPSPMLAVQPSIQDAKDYGTDEIEPMIRDTPVLSEVYAKGRDSGNTQLKKKFTNGAGLLLVGANSPRGFRRVTVRVVVFDEIDGYPVKGAGHEGDPIKLGTKRTETFWNRKIIKGSTPLVRGASRIDREYERSDRRVYAVPCPHCGGHLVLRFSEKSSLKITLPDGLAWALMRWPKGEPERAYFVCGHCARDIEEEHKAFMVENGVWVATAPFRGRAGFHIWAAYSLFPNARWGKLATEFSELRADRDTQGLQVFVNTVLGETWEDEGQRISDKELSERREDYEGAPRDVVVVTAGVDVQGNRLEVERVGWCADNQSYGLGVTVIHGDPTGADVWAALDDLLNEPVPHELGFPVRVSAVAVDSNYLTQTVQSWCSERWGRRVWAVRGVPGRGKPIWPKRPGKRSKTNLPFFNVGADSAKDTIYARLNNLEPNTPGYCHFNMTYDDDYFDQLTAEEAIDGFAKGMPTREWRLRPGKRRNEALDIRVYALAALEGLRTMGFRLREAARRLQAKATELGAPPKARPATDPTPANSGKAVPELVEEAPRRQTREAPSGRPRRRVMVRSRFMG